MNDLHAFLKAHGCEAACAFPLDGRSHRFHWASRKTGSFKGELIGPWCWAELSDWKSGARLRYKSPVKPEERLEFDTLCRQREALRAAERLKRHQETAAVCQGEWEGAIQRGHTPYMERKQIRELYGARINPHLPAVLWVPARDAEGKLWSIQTIRPEKDEDGQDKKMWTDGRVGGCFHTLGVINPKGLIYVCEGFATAASVHEATGAPTVCGFSASNLLAVSSALRLAYPDSTLVLAADNDQWTERNGKPWNPGFEYAVEAASGCGGKVVAPVFADLRSKPTDFNDLHVAEGLTRVKAVLENSALPEVQGKKKKRFSELAITEQLLAQYQDRLVKQDKTLFAYTGTHWLELEDPGICQLKNQINAACGGVLTSKEANSIYQTFYRYVPLVPPRTNLFQPARDRVNFRNGTLHVQFRPKTPSEVEASPAQGTHVFSLRFSPHSPHDWCTTLIPLDYREEAALPANAEYEQMLKNVWPTQGEGKVRFYEELLGACLVPMFPKITFFLGEPGTGKSTLIMLAAKLVGPENASRVDISTWGSSFGLEPMVNKLVNFNTDISTTHRIPDALAKGVIDGMFSISRKNKVNVEAHLPAVHVFGANEMPKSAEGMSGAYNRRAVILKTEVVQPGSGGGGDYSDWIWGRGPEGVLKAALRGLNRLLAQGGTYSQPECSKKEIHAWGRENDQVAQFLEAVQEGEVWAGQSGTAGERLKLVVENGRSIGSGMLYETFVSEMCKQNALGRFCNYCGRKHNFRGCIYGIACPCNNDG